MLSAFVLIGGEVGRVAGVAWAVTDSMGAVG
jgi:hypothetical protein